MCVWSFIVHLKWHPLSVWDEIIRYITYSITYINITCPKSYRDHILIKTAPHVHMLCHLMSHYELLHDSFGVFRILHEINHAPWHTGLINNCVGSISQSPTAPLLLHKGNGWEGFCSHQTSQGIESRGHSGDGSIQSSERKKNCVSEQLFESRTVIKASVMAVPKLRSNRNYLDRNYSVHAGSFEMSLKGKKMYLR